MKDFLEKGLAGYISILRDMVAINSWSENGEGIARLSTFTEELFRPLGFSAEKVSAKFGPGKHLILSRAGASTSCIALVSHLDTVYSPEEEEQENFVFEQKGDLIFGPGTCDIKGGTLLIYMLMDILAAKNTGLFEETSWQILFDATEETRSDDFGALCRERIPRDARACLVFEAGDFADNVFRVVTARKGRGVFRITARGPGGHAGVAHDSAGSAIDLLCRGLSEIHDFTDYEKGLTFNAGYVSGGSGLNRIAEEANADVEMRAFSPGAFSEGREKIFSLPKMCHLSLPEGSKKAVLEVKEVRSVPAWPRNEKTGHLAAIYRDSAEEMGYACEEEERGGLSDGNFIWDHVPVLDGLGPAGKFSHRSRGDESDPDAREHLVTSSLVPKTLLNARALEMILRG